MTDTTCDVLRACGRLRGSATFGHGGLAGLALGAALTVLSVGTADASYYYYYGHPSAYAPGSVYLPATPRPAAKKARRPAADQPQAGKPKGEAAARAPRGPLLVSVSLGDQRVRVFDAGGQVAEAPISSGTKSHPTLTGVFSIIQKNRHHFSNLYANAPMPYMQRLTWSGTAMHTGALPGYPASHGCIRMPNSFASHLWGMTKLGTRVIVARSTVTPVEISHPQLARFDRKPDAATPVVTLPAAPIKTAAAEQTLSDAPKPAMPLATSTSGAGEAAPAAIPAPADAPAAAPSATAPAGPPAPLVEYGPPLPQKSGPISIFVSKKEGKLFVRKNFEPIYETPVTISQPDAALGTHVFTAMALDENGRSLRWSVMSLPAEPRAEPVEGRKVRGAAAKAVPATTAAGSTASAREALERIELPAEVVERLAEMMAPGSSLIVSDKGLGPQTGRGTDFIVLTR
ncbi:L,D-transpeptidase family protein [Rhodoplanes serenus]|uniref:L,D-transpeptidase family protein n=1 Tax=Rhodoplanes serenus TaxID=200615 RepID=A0A3S4F8Q5_9BRAD|nr:L,D-transpeptidase [Rhodoplanes serenus]MTW15098.1 L,D-transpeptidase family protein [Rhodoplanes serenus]VCU08371.1 hypothetical protein RHODGE_RHODGE_01543 [Rhodoplanes serenus]